MKAIKWVGVETAFFTIVLPLFVVFVVLGVILGILQLTTLPFRKEKWRAYEPWRTIKMVGRVVWGHLRYLWNCEFLPRYKKGKERREAVTKQREALRQCRARRPSRREFRRKVNLSEFDSVDAVTVFLLIPYLLPFAIILPHLIIVTVGTISMCGFYVRYDHVEPRSEPRPEVRVEYEPRIADQQEADFGPWRRRNKVIERVNSPDFLNVALFSDVGSAKYSERFKGGEKGFKNRNSDRVVNPRVTSSGQIVFRDPHQNRFRVNSGQVFMFENYRSFAFRFTAEGQLQAVPLRELEREEL